MHTCQHKCIFAGEQGRNVHLQKLKIKHGNVSEGSPPNLRQTLRQLRI